MHLMYYVDANGKRVYTLKVRGIFFKKRKDCFLIGVDVWLRMSTLLF